MQVHLQDNSDPVLATSLPQTENKNITFTYILLRITYASLYDHLLWLFLVQLFNIGHCAQKVLIVSVKKQSSPLKGKAPKARTSFNPWTVLKGLNYLELLEVQEISQSGDCRNTDWGNLIYAWGWCGLLKESRSVREQWELRHVGSHPPCLNSAPFWQCLHFVETEDLGSIRSALGRLFFKGKRQHGDGLIHKIRLNISASLERVMWTDVLKWNLFGDSIP